jgi:hypothetical protein
MPFQYSFEEKTEMLLIFGECGRDATLAAETYAARFPQNRAPNHQIFKSLVSSLSERGTFQQSTKIGLVETDPYVGQRDHLILHHQIFSYGVPSKNVFSGRDRQQEII